MKNSMKNLVEKCIENAIERLTDNKNKMNTYAYITYFVKRNNLSIEEDLYIRDEVSKYIDKNESRLFEVSFTINGKKIA